jgi:hypothetical protein
MAPVLNYLSATRWRRVSLSVALQPFVGPWPWDSLDGGSARRKAATYTQNNTSTELTHTDIHALSGIQTQDPRVRASEDSSCLTPRGHCDRRWRRVGRGCVSPPFLTLALGGCEWSASLPGRFTPGTHLIGGWVGPRASLDVEKYRKMSCPCRKSKPRCPALSPSLYRLK